MALPPSHIPVATPVSDTGGNIPYSYPGQVQGQYYNSPQQQQQQNPQQQFQYPHQQQQFQYPQQQQGGIVYQSGPTTASPAQQRPPGTASSGGNRPQPVRKGNNSSLLAVIFFVLIAGGAVAAYVVFGGTESTSEDGNGGRTGAPGIPTTSSTPRPTPFTGNTPTTPTPGSGATHQFNIELLYVDPAPPQAIQNVFEAAAAKWSSLLLTDWTNLEFTTGGSLTSVCGEHADASIPDGYFLDDLLITVSVGAIDEDGDEEGNVLGFATNCYYFPEEARNGESIDPLRPRIGIMKFDEFDLDLMLSDGTLSAVILHEMGHVLGIGTLWDTQFDGSSFVYDLLDKSNPSDPRYKGAGGIRGLRDITGSNENIRPQVEGDGGEGTAFGHWDEETFEHELMTGFVGAGESPLSALTAKSLLDLGHVVDESKIEAYTLPAAGRRLDTTRRRMVRDTIPSIHTNAKTFNSGLHVTAAVNSTTP